MSEECDVWSKSRMEKVAVIADKLGKNTPYPLAHGVYVDPVDPGIVLLPSGWEQRLTPLRLDAVTAWCLGGLPIIRLFWSARLRGSQWTLLFQFFNLPAKI